MSMPYYCDIADVCAFINFHGFTPSTRIARRDSRSRVSVRAKIGSLLICESYLRRAHKERKKEDSLQANVKQPTKT